MIPDELISDETILDEREEAHICASFWQKRGTEYVSYSALR